MSSDSLPAPLGIVIRRVESLERERIGEHLCALSAEDRGLRFSWGASPEWLRGYARGLNFNRDIALGAFEPGEHGRLLGFAHVGVYEENGFPIGELGVSVDAAARGLGLGRRLVSEAIARAREAGLSRLEIHFLRRNLRMGKLAASFTQDIERQGDEATARIETAELSERERIQRVWVGGAGIELFVKEPEGPPRAQALLVHGSGGDGWQWRAAVQPELARRGARSVALSLRNHGGSDRRSEIGIEHYLSDIQAALDWMGDPRARLLGHSLGGYLVMRHLERQRHARAALLAPVPPQALGREDLRQACAELKCEGAREALGLAMRGAREVDLAKIQTPMIFIGGTKDRVVPLQAVRRAAVKTASPLLVLEGAGHAAMLHQRFAGLISEALLAPEGAAAR